MAKPTYMARIADAVLARHIALFGAVEVYGTKWAGKTHCA